jgi:hypothetical protein
MDKRTTAIVATVVTTLLCGCPGLAILCFGAFAVPVSFTPGAQIDVFGSNDPQSLLTTGIVGLCLGILLIAIPIVVGFTMLRNQPAAADMVVPPAPPRPAPPTPEVPPEPVEPPPAPPDEPGSEADASLETQVEAPAEEPSEPPAAPPEESPLAEPPAPEDDDAIPPAI